MAACLVLVGISSSVSAQHWFVSQDRAKERVVGLLDLGDVTGNYEDDRCEKKAGVRLFGKPSTLGAAIGTIYMRMHPEFGCGLLFNRAQTTSEEELPSEESGYEMAAAVVYERRGLWFRVATPQGSAWIERSDDSEFHPYPQILVERMAYLRANWDGQLRQSAGFETGNALLSAEWKARIPRQIAIEVIGLRQAGGMDWIHVRLMDERCGDDARLKPVEGWVPAYRSDGTPSAWFYSRGC
jgi:hypothetical protein